MTGHDYAKRVARYLACNYSSRGLTVYEEIPLGKSIIGKNRRVDILAINDRTGKAFAVECKFQATSGTADEKIPYTLRDMGALPMAAAVAYAGEGFSRGVLHMLEASEIAAHCLPGENLERSRETRELDHLLAMHFGWWDLLVDGKSAVLVE